MKIADLFLGLNVKGDAQAKKKLDQMDTSLKGLYDKSLAWKAAIAASIYTVGRMMNTAGQTGAALSRFNSETGLSVEKLQQLQRAAQEFGVEGSEIENSLKGIQNAMNQWRFTGQAPQAITEIQKILGGDFDVKRAWQDPLYVLKQLQTALKDTAYDASQMNFLLQGFGVGSGTIGFLRQEKDIDNLKKYNVLSERQVRNLNKMRAGISDIGIEFDKAFADFFAKNGEELVNNFKEFIPIFKEFMEVISETVKLFVDLEKETGVIKSVAGGTARGVNYLRKGGYGADLADNVNYAKERGVGKWIVDGLKNDYNRFFGSDKPANNQGVKVEQIQVNVQSGSSDPYEIGRASAVGSKEGVEKAMAQSKSTVRRD